MMATREQLLAERARRQAIPIDALKAERQRRQMAQLSELTQNPRVRQEGNVQGGGVENRLEQPQTLRQQMGLTLPQMGQSLRDNLIGDDDDTTLNRGEALAAALNKGGESLTLGVVGDEAAGAFDEAVGRRENGTEFYRNQEEQLREQSPAAYYGAEIGGAMVAPGVGAANLIARGATNGARLARGAGVGAAAGGIYGAAEGEGGIAERAIDGAVGATVGGVLGAGIPAAADKVGRGLRNLWQRAETRPSVGLLREVKNRAYRAVEEAGEKFDGEEMTGLSQRVRAMMDADVSYVPGEDTAVDAAVRTLTRREGQETTLSQLDTIRKSLWRRVTSKPEQVQIYDLIAEIDNVIENRAGASELMATAREANRQFSQTQLLDRAFQRARDQAESTGSGGNVANLYRQAVTRIVNNPKQARFFSDDQVALMRDFLRDSKGQRAQRLIGKMSPSGNGLMMTLQVLGGVATSGATVPLAVAGSVAKGGADRAVERGADALLDVTSGFRPVTPLPTIGQNPLAAGQVAATSANSLLRNRQ